MLSDILRNMAFSLWYYGICLDSCYSVAFSDSMYSVLDMSCNFSFHTQAEEIYANRIVRDFNLGALPDCKPGVTLRAYLARKLHCSPMRISKKYAGNNVGKAMYLAKGTHSLPMHRPGMPVVPRAPNSPTEQAPLFNLEALFYRSIDCGSGNVSGACSSASSSAPTPSAGTSLGPTPPPLSFVPPADGTTCCIPPMYQQAAASQKGMPFYPGFVQVPHAPDQNNMPQHVPGPVSYSCIYLCFQFDCIGSSDPVFTVLC